MQVTTFTGEGATYRFRQGFEAITGVAAHEALNIRVFKRYAINTNKEIIDTEIKIKFAIDPETKRLVVVGGESQAKFKAKGEKKQTEILFRDPEEIKEEIRKLIEEERILENTASYNNPIIDERLASIRRKINSLRLEALIKGVVIDVVI